MRGGRKLPQAKKIELMTEACSFVNLKFAELTNKYPFELSGGQMQRLMIARIFLLKPKILLADEPTSMIDACSRATILDYLMKLRDETGMTLIFITHDIGLAYYVSDSVYIMEHGKFVEQRICRRGDSASEGAIHQAPDQRCAEDLRRVGSLNRVTPEPMKGLIHGQDRNCGPGTAQHSLGGAPAGL